MRSWCSKEVELTLNSVSIVITLHAPTTEFAPQLFEDSLLGTPIEACSQGKITNTRTMVTCTLSNKQNGLFLCSVGSVLLL